MAMEAIRARGGGVTMEKRQGGIKKMGVRDTNTEDADAYSDPENRIQL